MPDRREHRPVGDGVQRQQHQVVADGEPAGRGSVRAKTGTLTGVNALAGLVRDRTGRLRAFAFIGDGSPGPQDLARAALGIEGITRQAPLEDQWDASALVGVRYTF